jgi:hypothetical protein
MLFRYRTVTLAREEAVLYICLLIEYNAGNIELVTLSRSVVQKKTETQGSLFCDNRT